MDVEQALREVAGRERHLRAQIGVWRAWTVGAVIMAGLALILSVATLLR